MKTKRIVALTLCAVAMSGMAAFSGCGQTVKGVKKDPKTVNVKMTNAGYGSAWLKEIAEKFETLYASEGYKINVMTPQEGYANATALSEMGLGAETGIDLVLTSGVYPEDVASGTYAGCAETLNDIYDSKPINFDGSYGEKTLKELSESNSRRLKYGSDYYDFYWYGAPSGLVVNKTVLAGYNITEMPRTTDELLGIYDAMIPTAKSTGVYPVTWAGDNAYGYALNPLYTHTAQMMGVEAYDDFFALDSTQNEDGSVKADGWKIYQNEDFKPIIQTLTQLYDVLYSYPESETQKHDVAHSQLMMGRAAFMFDGLYFYNEVKANFGSKLGDIDFLRTPVISALGVKLKLDGSGADKAKCDDILSYMIKLVDEEKTQEEIKTQTETQFSVTLTDEQVKWVWEARRTGSCNYQADAYVIKGSGKADIAKLFLRMLASEDAAKVQVKYGMPNAYTQVDAPADVDQFLKSGYTIAKQNGYNVSSVMYVDSVRKGANIFLLFGEMASIARDISAAIGVPANGLAGRDYVAIAESYYNKMVTAAQSGWAGRIKDQGGYVIK